MKMKFLVVSAFILGTMTFSASVKADNLAGFSDRYFELSETGELFTADPQKLCYLDGLCKKKPSNIVYKVSKTMTKQECLDKKAEKEKDCSRSGGTTSWTTTKWDGGAL